MKISRLLDKISQGITNSTVFMEILAELGAFVLAIVVIWGVILTYVFGKSDIFSVEVSEYLLVFICFTSIAYVLKEDRHVKVEVFTEKLPHRARLVMDIFTSFLSLIFCIIVTWKTVLVMSLNYKRGFLSSSLINFPLWIPYLFIAFGFFLLALQYFVRIRELAGKLRNTHKYTKNILKKGVI